MNPENPDDLAEDGKRLFKRGQYDQAAELFRRAADAYAQSEAGLPAAETKNNLSVTLLQAGKPFEALEAARGTDEVFSAASDRKRQAMAIGNQAAALEALHRPDEALEAYARAEAIFAELGEGDLRALVKKSMAAIRLKRGEVLQSALSMVGSVEAKSNPSLFDRLLRFLLRLKPW
jgi:tetratricopeptide (TPR) repeat protein